MRGLEIFEPPTFRDPIHGRRGRLLYRVLSVTFPILLLLTIYPIVSRDLMAASLYGMLVVSVFAALVLLRRDRFQLAAVLCLLSIWLSSSLNVAVSGGLGASATGSFAIVVLCAGFFWNFRGALLFAALSTGVILAMALWGPEFGLAAPPGSSVGRYVGELVAQMVTAALVMHFALSFITETKEELHGVELAALTREAELEQQLRESKRFEALGRLSAGVAHDFNNLLSAMTCNVDLLEIDVARNNAQAHESLNELRETVTRAGQLSAQLLAVGRRRTLTQIEFGLDPLVEHMQGLLGTLAGDHINLEFNLAAGEGSVCADASELERVIINLVTNARDALGGSGTIEISTSRGDTELYLCVRDTGVGMSEDVIAQVFEPFFTTKGERGTGLGLATSHSIVQRGGGRIEIDSTVGEGTCVRVVLPLFAV